MKILGIESSCDETSAAVVDDGAKLLSNVVASQIEIHKEYGGVVPEIAARNHIEAIIPVINKALTEAKCSWDDIDAIAVTRGPGLSGALLIGTLTARTLALAKKKPLYGVNHVEGHVYANWLIEPKPEFPVLALICSGLHTELVLFKNHGEHQMLGHTRDDAVGEAFDKVARIIGLPYPGGPAIQAAAKAGDPHAFKFPVAKLDTPYEFSFSGLKTAVLRQVQSLCGKDYDFPSFNLAELLSESQRNDLAASFQYGAVKTLVDKTMLAHKEFQPKTVIIGGGVAASAELRRQLTEALPIEINYAPISLCTDNAAMIATLGYYESQRREPDDPNTLKIDPSLSL